jgi:hypothetical protein
MIQLLTFILLDSCTARSSSIGAEFEAWTHCRKLSAKKALKEFDKLFKKLRANPDDRSIYRDFDKVAAIVNWDTTKIAFCDNLLHATQPRDWTIRSILSGEVPSSESSALVCSGWDAFHHKAQVVLQEANICEFDTSREITGTQKSSFWPWWVDDSSRLHLLSLGHGAPSKGGHNVFTLNSYVDQWARESNAAGAKIQRNRSPSADSWLDSHRFGR